MEQIKIYLENEEFFDEVMEQHYEVDPDWNNWVHNVNRDGYEDKCRVFSKKTGHRVGWYTFERFIDDDGLLVTQAYITLD